jgi:hypothetical protein
MSRDELLTAHRAAGSRSSWLPPIVGGPSGGGPKAIEERVGVNEGRVGSGWAG